MSLSDFGRHRAPVVPDLKAYTGADDTEMRRTTELYLNAGIQVEPAILYGVRVGPRTAYRAEG